MTQIAKRQESLPANPVTPMDMLQMAVQQGADLDKLEKLMDLQQRWEANQSRKAFVAALNAFKAAPPKLTKNKDVAYGNTKYSHASLDHVSAAIGKALSDNGLSHRWDTEQQQGVIRVTCILTHDAGHTERTTLEAGADQSGQKNSIQAIGSTISYLQRYTLLAATGMAVGDQDDDGRGAEPPARISDKQHSTLIDLLAATESDEAKFLKWVQVDALENIPASMYARCEAQLKRKLGDAK